MRSLTEDFIETKQAGRRVVALTAYDYPMARLLDEAGVDIVLVGDSLGMVVMGLPDTTQVTLAAMQHHTSMVARAAKKALVVADLPFGTYETPAQALESAKVLIQAGARGVKLEGGVSHQAHIALLVSEKIPVMGHIGMLPQSVVKEGAYRIKGRDPSGKERLIQDAQAVEKAGAFSVVLELVHAPVAKEISSLLSIPTIGIGSGQGCDGSILVTHDLIGLFPWFTPKFVHPRATISQEISRAVKEYIKEVQTLPKV